ncbi:hypothetical protein KAI32_03570, partial [Candidatus Pacearchaeota archaeon]|nr:hypothetical protein [Candidatus Pacearchaeota archaeon]
MGFVYYLGTLVPGLTICISQKDSELLFWSKRIARNRTSIRSTSYARTPNRTGMPRKAAGSSRV